MLSHHPNLNPAVTRAAELLSDRGLSDALLRDVAIMRGLPLLIERDADAGPSALTLAQRELASAQAEHRAILAIYRGACARLGEANARFTKPLRAGGVRYEISAEVRRRALMRKATARLDAARAALAALAH